VGFEQMLRRRRQQINGDPAGRAWRLLSAAADVARWPFERAAWTVERHLLWPLQRQLAGWSPPGHRVGAAAALAGIGVAAILIAVLILPGGGAPAERTAQQTRLAIVPPSEPRAQAEEPQGPTLQGAQPRFGGLAAEQTTGDRDNEGGGGSASSGSASTASGSEASSAADAESAQAADATASASRKPVPAGPAAMKVARRFSEAFVYYEIGKRPARAKTVFGETAVPRLAEALAEREPRLPADGTVPKAKVLNLVPGPRAGKAYTVSVSLLRVGLTSELRLELNKQKGQWLVTDVRG
jgi:hypothetical protein